MNTKEGLLLGLKWYLIVTGIVLHLILIYTLNQKEKEATYVPRGIQHEYHSEEMGGAIAPRDTPKGPPGVVNGAYVNCNHRQYPRPSKEDNSDKK